MNQLSSKDTIYLAGILDGGCSLLMNRMGRRYSVRKEKTKKYYSLLLRLQRMSPTIPKTCYKITGVGRFFFSLHQARGGTYLWEVTGSKNVKEILSAVYPYLKEKRELVKLLLQFDGKTADEIYLKYRKLRKSNLWK